MKKILCIFIIITLLLSFAACNNKADETETETEEESYVMTDISGIPSPFSINGEEVPYAVFRYYFAAVKYRYDRDDDSYWDKNDYSEKIRDEVMRYIRRNYAVVELAKQYEVELSDIEKKQIKQQLYSERMSQYEDDNDYYRALDAYFLTDEVNYYVE